MKIALLIVDLQNDFLPDGALGVKNGDNTIEPSNKLIRFFEQNKRHIFFSRDWHPVNHCSFKENGGIWPVHCVKNTRGAELSRELYRPNNYEIISKAENKNKEAYSAFEGTGLRDKLHRLEIDEIVLAGLATDYCVKNTVIDAVKEGFKVIVIIEGIEAVNVNPDDGEKALEEMKNAGARLLSLNDVLALRL